MHFVNVYVCFAKNKTLKNMLIIYQHRQVENQPEKLVPQWFVLTRDSAINTMDVLSCPQIL